MKISVQYSNVKNLTPIGGDFVNELNFIDTLSHFAEVRYGRPFGCDINYVRGNSSIFAKTPRIKLWMASPFVEKSYNDADYIVTFTEEWAKRIREGNDFSYIPKVFRRPYTNVINISQAVGENFYPRTGYALTEKIRNSVGGDLIIGHFGRIVGSNYPSALLKLLPELKGRGISVLFGSSPGQMCFASDGKIMRFPHEEVPYAISACDLIVLSNWGYEWDFCGSGKILEASACGVPIICGRSPARIEFFGEDYPLFHSGFNKGVDVYRYTNEERMNLPVKLDEVDELEYLIDLACENYELREKIGRDLCYRAEYHKPRNLAKKLKPIFDGIKEKRVFC